MPTMARVEVSSLTPTLSRREREPRRALGDIPEPQPCELSRLVSANTPFHLSQPAAQVLLLPAGEGRDEGRSLRSSRGGSWSQDGILYSVVIRMKTPFPKFVLLWLLAVLSMEPLHGAVTSTEWPRQMSFEVSKPGLTRVELTIDALALTRPDRGDVRVLDPAGQEVPWRLRRGLTGRPPATSLTITSLVVRVENRRSVIEFDTGTEARLSGLRLVTSATGFFKPATLEGFREGNWERLVTGVPLYQAYQGATEVQLDVAPGNWTRLRLVLDDRRTAPIPIRSVVLIVTPAGFTDVATSPAVIRARSEEPGVTRLPLDLGAAGLDVAWIELETPEPLFTRPVRVLSERFSGDAVVTEELVHAWVHRVPGDAGTAEDSRRIRVDRTIPTREIVLVVENGDSPPLASPSVRVGLHAQQIEFWATQLGEHRLLAGNAFAEPPRYDISRLVLPAELSAETLKVDGAWVMNPEYREPAVGAEALGRGAVFEAKGWRRHRTVTVGAGAGAAEIELPVDVVSVVRPDLGDLRLVRDGRQIPYVADRQTLRRKLEVNVQAEVVPPKSRLSLWRLELDAPGVPLAVLRVDTPQAALARWVRWYEVVESREGDRWTNVLAHQEWSRVPGTALRPLELTPGHRLSGRVSWIEIDDGDNPPLPTLAWSAEYTTRRIYFLGGGTGAIDLFYDHPEAVVPRYDLSLLADRLNASSRTVATLGPVTERDRGWGEAVVSGKGMMVLFWAVLAGVVVALLVIIRRLLPAPPVQGP